MLPDIGLTLHDLVQLGGYAVVAMGVYYGIKLDLAKLHLKILAMEQFATETKIIAVDAQTKLYNHINQLYRDRRDSDHKDN